MANKTNRNKRSPRARPPPIYSEQRHRAQQVCAEQRNIDAGKHGVHWWAQTRGRGFASVEEKRGREEEEDGERKKRTKPVGEDGLVT